LGGINGREIELITLDDSYEPQYAIQNTNELIKNKKVFAMFGEVGTPSSEAVLPIIKEYNIPFLTPLTGVDSVRDNESGLIFNLRNSYKDETKAMIQYLVTELKLKKIAVFYQDDSYGKSGYNGVKDALKEYELEIIEEGRYRRNTLSFHNALLNINHVNPEAVIIIGTQKPSGFT
jgi:ABC-type branched-subunit amino acid transport system substrate-binding protein